MKRNHILLGVLALGALFSSCTFLDKMPDSRTELNRADKIERLLVTAYPTLMPMGFVEHRTDKVEALVVLQIRVLELRTIVLYVV